ncbi:MAG: hypothetical protein E6G38_10735 [Actinobacteria bacterium]|nr:MAG: hypothetical protein E6G38_10735 [Actinomycetota bacterium]
MRAPARVDMIDHVRMPCVRNVHDRNRPGALTERDPQLVPGPVSGHVMRAEADVDATCDATTDKVDHHELPARIVGDVRESSVCADQGDVRRAEASQHLHDL